MALLPMKATFHIPATRPSPFFSNRLHEDATVILDDSCRRPEREIRRPRWNREFGLNLEQNVLKGDIFHSYPGQPL